MSNKNFKINKKIMANFLAVSIACTNIGWMPSKDICTKNVAWADERIIEATQGEDKIEINAKPGEKINIPFNGIEEPKDKGNFNRLFIEYDSDIPTMSKVASGSIPEDTSFIMDIEKNIDKLEFTLPKDLEKGDYNLSNGHVKVGYYKSGEYTFQIEDIYKGSLPNVVIHVKNIDSDTAKEEPKKEEPKLDDVKYTILNNRIIAGQKVRVNFEGIKQPIQSVPGEINLHRLHIGYKTNIPNVDAVSSATENLDTIEFDVPKNTKAGSYTLSKGHVNAGWYAAADPTTGKAPFVEKNFYEGKLPDIKLNIEDETNKDTIKPVITTNLENKTVKASEISFTASSKDDVDGNVNTSVTVNGEIITGNNDNYTAKLNKKENIIIITAVDSSGNEAKESYTITNENQVVQKDDYEIVQKHIYPGTKVTLKLNNVKLKDVTKIKYNTDIPSLSSIETSDVSNGTIDFTIPAETKVGTYKLNGGYTYKVDIIPPGFPIESTIDQLPDVNINVEHNGSDANPPVIKLNGDATVKVSVGQPYKELGANGIDDIDKNINIETTYTKDGNAVDNIDTASVGSYIVHYNAVDSGGNKAIEVTRTVNVEVTASKAPIIELIGAKEITIAKGSKFQDAGISITDDMDKNLKAVVTYTKDGKTVDNIDTNIEGEYIVHYNAADCSGNKAMEVTRKVIVAAVSGVDFSSDTTSTKAVTKISFNGLYSGEAKSWAWDFDNDGKVDSTEQNPQYTYVQPGTYTVKLTVNGTENKLKENYIKVNPYEELKTAIGWLNYKNGIHNNGITNEKSPISENPKEEWSKSLGGDWMGGAVGSTSLVVDNYVYVMSNGGKVCKFNRKTGEQIWITEKLGMLILGTPTYGNGKLFVPAENGNLRAIDTETGKTLWEKQFLQGKNNSPILFKDGLIYTGSWDNNGKYICATENGDKIWEYKGSFYWAGATIIGDKILVGNENGELITLNRFTGNEIQNVKISKNVTKDCEIRTAINYIEKDKKVYFGTKDNKLVSFSVNEDGTFNESTKRTLDCGVEITSAPVVYNGRIYVGTGSINSNNGFKVIDEKTFSHIYTVDTVGGVQGGPVLTTAYATKENKNTVYVYFTANDANGTLYCIKDFEGNTQPQKVFTYVPSKEEYCMSTPSIYDGYIYYGNDSASIFAIKGEEKTEVIEKQFNVQSTYTIGKTNNATALEGGKILTANVNVENTKATDEDVMVLVVLYDANGSMINVSYISQKLASGENKKLTAGFKLPDNTSGYSVKSFVWDGTDLNNTKNIPLSNVNEIK